MSKHWSWAYFTTDGTLFQSNDTFKNAWCIACFYHQKELLRRSGVDVDWEAQARINSPPVVGKPGQSMVPHLSKCGFVALDVKARSLEDVNAKKTRANAPGGLHKPPPMLGRSSSMGPLPAIAFPGSAGPLPFPTATFSATPSPALSPLLMSDPLLTFDRPLKRPRTPSLNAEICSGSSSSPGATAWNPLLQQEFGEDFLQLLIANGISRKDAQHPQVRLFVEKWIPGAIVPDMR